MRPFAPGEWSATLGLDALAPLLGVYVFSLVPALLIASAPLQHAVIVGVIIWTGGALMITAGCAYCLSRFHRHATGLLLPIRRAVLMRAIAAWTAIVVVLPAISFWTLVPGSQHWTVLIAAAPIVAALTVSCCLRAYPARERRRDGNSVRGKAPTAVQVMAMFLGSPFTRFPSGLRARAAAALGLALWATPPALCLMLSARAARFLIIAYLVLTVVVTWGWFMVALARFASHRAGNFAELALLPGLGDATQRRRALYRAALTRPLLLLFCALSVFIGVAGWHSHSASGIGRLALSGVVLLLFWCGGIFQLLLTAKEGAGRRVRVISTINATLVPLVLSQGVVQALSGPASSWLSRPGAQWLSLLLLGLLASAPLLMIWLYTSGVARQPHPFLAPAD